MANEAARDQLAALLDSYQSGLRSLHQLQEQRAKLTASASAADGQVTVTVDADGILTNIEFSSEDEALSYAEIADAVVLAARDAAVEVHRQAAEVVATLQHEDPSMPTLSDFLPGAPDLMELVPGDAATLLTPSESTTTLEEHEQKLTDATPRSVMPDVAILDRGWENDSSVYSKRVAPGTQEGYERHHSAGPEVTDRGR